MSFPKYPAYKASDVEGLGKIPEGWSVTRLRFVAQFNPSKNEISCFPENERVSFLPMEAISENGSINLKQNKKISELNSGYTYFKDMDIILAKITPCFENGKVALAKNLLKGIGFGTTELIVSRVLSNYLMPQYLLRLFQSDFFRKPAEASMYGAGGQKRVSEQFVRNFTISLPPLSEQKTIATFLDRECAKIDALIAEQERLITLLQEKRQAVISHAVTKGLEPNVPMKESGIEWIGEMPERWSVSSIKRCSYLKARVGWKGLTSDEFEENSYAYLVTGSDFRGSKIQWHQCYQVNKARYDDDPFIHLLEGDLLITKDGTVGKLALVEGLDKPACLNSGIFLLRPLHSYLTNFMEWVLRSKLFSHFVDLRSYGSTIHHLYQNVFEEFSFPLPTLSEQITIATFLNSECAKIDSLINHANQNASLLKERRSALISAAVTGKIDVRKLVKPKDIAA